jgi:hypothetical protein
MHFLYALEYSAGYISLLCLYTPINHNTESGKRIQYKYFVTTQSRADFWTICSEKLAFIEHIEQKSIWREPTSR